MKEQITGQAITFYSYKGGTGRTMALANIACLFAKQKPGNKVLMIDWDLEAPGLHRFFRNYLTYIFTNPIKRDDEIDSYPGLIDLFIQIVKFTDNSNWSENEIDELVIEDLFNKVELDKFIIETDISGLYILKAGRIDENYSSKINSFSWEKLFNRSPWLLPAFVKNLTSKYNYVFIDSRTGLTDISGICTMLLPEKLVVVFTPNRQSLVGALNIIDRAIHYRKQSNDLRPLTVFPFVSRVELAEEDLRKYWRHGNDSLNIVGYQPLFENAFKKIYNLDECDLTDYFNEVQAQHVTRYAYGEEIAVLNEEQIDERLSLATSYRVFSERLISLNVPWENLKDLFKDLEFAPKEKKDTIQSHNLASMLKQNKDLLPVSVFISAPGDVKDELCLAIELLEQLPYDPLLLGKVSIRTVTWGKLDENTPMVASLTPQESINRGLPKPSDCDIAIFIFWSRMGTQLPLEFVKPDGNRYFSGTEWEYLDAMQGAKRNRKPKILVYRRTEVPLIGLTDPEVSERLNQWGAVEAFFESFRNSDGSIRSGFNSYSTPYEFREQLNYHLRTLIKDLFQSVSTERLGETIQSIAGTSPPLPRIGSPFIGLRAFSPSEAPIFFGRGPEIDGLLSKMADPKERFVVVVGASGSGKTSLVSAGLIPRLEMGAIKGSQGWDWVRLTPGDTGDNPFRALANALVVKLPPGERQAHELESQLRTDPETMVQLVDEVQWRRTSSTELLLFIDQLEELFTLVTPNLRELFINFLEKAARTERLHIVATLRADFVHKCLEWTKLAKLFQNGLYLLSPPGPAALYEIVTRPAEIAGLIFEVGLVDKILNDTGTEVGSLPLLAFALARLHETRMADGYLTFAAYENFGGIKGVIEQLAEMTFMSLDTTAQLAMNEAFKELIEVDEYGMVYRRRSALSRVSQNPASMALIESFTAAHLLIMDLDRNGEPAVEIAHEALLRSWPRLSFWVQSISEDLRLLRQIRLAAAEWDQMGRSEDYRWAKGRLIHARQILNRLRPTLSDVEELFINAPRKTSFFKNWFT